MIVLKVIKVLKEDSKKEIELLTLKRYSNGWINPEEGKLTKDEKSGGVDQEVMVFKVHKNFDYVIRQIKEAISKIAD